ncbi:hypothetical protein AB0L00_32390 [Actinoallomurus sp. NPDC052308]|uniref:hypothetical protein n=1 Tax=Actinoallomurus sp. NPDC052308 TaxID=3155530 RepID=UPI003419AD61
MPKAVACAASWNPTSSGRTRGVRGKSTTSATTRCASRSTLKYTAVPPTRCACRSASATPGLGSNCSCNRWWRPTSW